MNTFTELYQHFPEKMMELCLDACISEGRPVYYVDEFEEFNETCWFCERQRLFPECRYALQGGEPFPSNYRDPTCGGELCLTFQQFFHEGPKAYTRRKRFRAVHGSEPGWFEPKDRLVEACLAAILHDEASARNGKVLQPA